MGRWRVVGGGGIVLGVLESRDEALVLLSVLAAHHGGFADDHHVLKERIRQVTKRRTTSSERTTWEVRAKVDAVGAGDAVLFFLDDPVGVPPPL